MHATANRRLHSRFAANIECKVLRCAASKYDIAKTGDVSAGGALLLVRTTRPVCIGEEIEIAVNWADRPLLLADEMVGARVVRVGPVLDGSQLVAIRFDRVQEQAEVLAGAEAA